MSGKTPRAWKKYVQTISEHERDDDDDKLSLRNGRPTEGAKRFSPSQISETQRAGFEPTQNLSSYFAEGSCTVAITTTPRR